MKRLYTVSFLFLLCIPSVKAQGVFELPGIPLEMAYQGVLEDESGPVNGGPHELTFNLYVEDGIDPEWTETHSDVGLTDGLFSVILGSYNPLLPSLFGRPLYISIQLDGGEEIGRRTPLSSSPYTLTAHQVVGDLVYVRDATTENKSYMVGGALQLSRDAGSVIYMNAADGDAKVGIGTDMPTHALTVMGDGWFSGEVIHITSTRAKENIEPIEDALELVSHLNGYTYDYRTDEYPQYKMPASRRMGFLAEEVNQVLPEVVSNNGEEFAGVSYSRITALLVEAVKELREENASMRMRLERLEGRETERIRQ